MQNSNEDEIIDLTDPINCYIPRNSGRTFPVIEVINLDDSQDDNKNTVIPNHSTNSKVNESDSTKTGNREEGGKAKKIGLCSICWEELGKRQLASTKCGHVYCLKCLEQCLKRDPKCPMCRRTLKGPSAYHPIYLELM